jgi:O-antigen ligase
MTVRKRPARLEAGTVPPIDEPLRTAGRFGGSMREGIAIEVLLPAPALDPLAAVWFVFVFGLSIAIAWYEGAAAPAVLIVTDPFALTRYIGHVTTITTFKAALAGVLIGIALRRGFSVPRNPAVRWIMLVLLLLAAATLLTVTVATSRGVALRETAKALEYALAFFVTWSAARQAPDRTARLLAFACAFTIVLVAADSVRDFAHPQSGMWINGRAILRLAGHLEGPNQLAAWLAIVIPVVVLLPFRAAIVPLCVGAITLAMTLSRTGAAQAFGALAVLSIVNRRLWPAFMVWFVAAALGVSLLALSLRSDVAALHYVSVAQSTDQGGTGSRQILWTAAVRMFKAHPILGVGAGNFELELAQYGAPPRVRTQANSLYLESLADGGVVLGLFTVLVALLPPLLLVRGPRTSLAFVVGIVGFALAIHGLADDVTFYTKVGQCWWVVAGAGAATLEPRDST